MRRECRERFPRYRGLAILTCITVLAWRACRDACRDRLLAVSFEIGGGENVPGIPGACTIVRIWQEVHDKMPCVLNWITATNPIHVVLISIEIIIQHQVNIIVEMIHRM